MQIFAKSLSHLRSNGIVIFLLLILLSVLGVLDLLSSTSAAAPARSTIVTGTMNPNDSNALFDFTSRSRVVNSSLAKADGAKKAQSPTQAIQKSGAQPDPSQ